MLTKSCHIVFGQEVSESTYEVSAFELRYSNKLDDDIQWQSDPERFSLVANETIKVGQPVNRSDADYWIGQFARLGAIGEGERVGRVKVEVTR